MYIFLLTGFISDQARIFIFNSAKNKNNQNYNMQVFDTINKDTPLYTGNTGNHEAIVVHYTTI